MGGYIYLICDPDKDTYKIGVTRNLALKRLKRLLTGNSTELHIVKTFYTDYPFRTETLLHNKFKLKQACGEWFYLTNEDICNFEDTCKQTVLLIESLKDNPYFSKDLK